MGIQINGYTDTISASDGSMNVLGVLAARGGGTNQIFHENEQVVINNYEITTGNNALSAGPITIDGGVVVTIPAGSTWTIV